MLIYKYQVFGSTIRRRMERSEGGNMEDRKKLREKISDYHHFSFVLTALSAFLYIGIFIDQYQYEGRRVLFLATGMILLLLFAFFFRFLSGRYERALAEMDEE